MGDVVCGELHCPTTNSVNITTPSVPQARLIDPDGTERSRASNTVFKMNSMSSALCAAAIKGCCHNAAAAAKSAQQSEAL
jgi:hypothetical protein